jgi:hypothetical protein
LLESYNDSINGIEDGQSLEQKQNYIPSLSLGKKYYITNLNNQHCVLHTKLMLYKTAFGPKALNE